MLYGGYTKITEETLSESEGKQMTEYEVEYIKREDAIKTLCDSCEHKGFCYSKDVVPSCPTFWHIMAIPAAKVEDRKTGHWENIECGVYCCSECGRPTDDRHDEIREFDGKTVIALCLPRYCGFCGAYMREDGDAT